MLLSIIIPVYNSHKYLEKCLSSVMRQSYDNLEIIIVDDGSTDGSSEICDRYAVDDKRFKVIHKSNEGLVSARKVGVSSASGEFIGFVDSDDYIDQDYFERLVCAREKDDADIVCCGYRNILGDRTTVFKNEIPAGTYVEKQIMKSSLYAGRFYEYGILPVLVSKIFRKDILIRNQLSVPDSIVVGEDAAVTYPSICDSSTITIIDSSGYNYIRHPGSLTTQMKSDEISRVQVLTDYLEKSFKDRGVWDEMAPSLQVYKNFITAVTDIRYLDTDKDKEILSPYGGVTTSDNVVIYGAGVLGSKIYSYIKDDGLAHIVAWLDKNDKVYSDQGLPVENPEVFFSVKQDYDYILIANITEGIADSIRMYLICKGVPEDKIRWFTKEFRGLN